MADDLVAAELARMWDGYGPDVADVERLRAALEAVLELADQWQRFAVPGDVGYDDAQVFREAISRALLGEEKRNA